MARQHQDTRRSRVESDDSTDFGGEDAALASGGSSSSDEALSDSSVSTIHFDDLSDDAEGASYPATAHVTRYSVIGTYTTFEDALAGLYESTPHIYVYVTRYESRNRHARIYECVSHVACGHRAKVASIVDVDGDVFYEVSTGGTHAAQATARWRRGIHPRLVQEIDSLLSVGWSGGQLRTLLQLRYRNDEATLLLIPTARQLTNRKAYLMRNAPGGWVITDHATFNAWASTRLCATRAQFDEVTDVADPRMNELIVLDSFHFPGEPSTFGVVVTSRRIFRNIATAIEGQGSRLVLSTDGTYKLDYAGWTLIAVGTVRIRWSRQEQAQEFIPWFYVFVRTESAAAYRRAFEVARATALTFLDVELDVRFATLDHSEAIALALEETWPGVRLLTCWPHVARQTRKKRVLLSDVDRYDNIIKADIDLLHTARSHEQFIRMAEIITDSWVNLGEQDYANWFRSVYLVRRWDRWHVNGADEPGIISNQNPIEAHHRVVKRTCSPSARASTTGVLTQIIPRILSYDGENLCPTSVTLVCEGPLIPEMVAKARRFHASPGNFRHVYQGRGRNRRVIGVLFNSRRYLNEPGNVLRSAVTEARARRFSASLVGQVSEGIASEELRFELLSLHCVRIVGVQPPTAFTLPAVWEGEDVRRVRAFLRCTCKAHARSGWICSHVLATLALYRLLDLDVALAQVPVRRGPGRPPTRGAALTAEEAQEGYFNIDRLARLFVRRPGQPMQWKILDDFDLSTTADDEASSFVGTVVGFRLSDGVYLWTASFDKQDYRDYDAQQLATAVNRAHVAGVNVTR